MLVIFQALEFTWIDGFARPPFVPQPDQDHYASGCILVLIIYNLEKDTIIL